jgi:hypothetical protein
MKRSSIHFWIHSYFLSHKAVQVIEPVLRYRKGSFILTSPFFAAGVALKFKRNGASLLFETGGEILDCIRDFDFINITRMKKNFYINRYELRGLIKTAEPPYYEHTRTPVLRVKRYSSRREIYIKECLDLLIEGIVSKKFLQPVKWQSNDDACTASFAGDSRISKDATDCNWSYPLRT